MMTQENFKSGDSPPPPYSTKRDAVLSTAATNYGYISNKDDTDDVAFSADALEKKNDFVKPEVKVNIEEEDPWKISNVYVEVIPWSELTTCGKFKRVVWDYFGKVVLLIGFLYLFICSLDFLSNAFKLIGGTGFPDEPLSHELPYNIQRNVFNAKEITLSSDRKPTFTQS